MSECVVYIFKRGMFTPPEGAGCCRRCCRRRRVQVTVDSGQGVGHGRDGFVGQTLDLPPQTNNPKCKNRISEVGSFKKGNKKSNITI